MFFEFSHGGHALAKGAGGARAKGQRDTISLVDAGIDFDPDTMTPFRYLIDKVGPDDLLPVSPATVAALDKLGEAIVKQQSKADTDKADTAKDDLNPDANIPPIFTYWSQFIDHELTARTDRNEAVSDITVDDANLKPVDRAVVERDLLNRRTPALDLDVLYGDGAPGKPGRSFPAWFGKGFPVGPDREFPTSFGGGFLGGPGQGPSGPGGGFPGSRGHGADHAWDRNTRLARKMRDGAKMRIGTAELVLNAATNQPVGPVPPPAADLDRDLPRIGALLAQGIVKKEDFPESLQKSDTFKQRAFIGDPRNDENLAVAQFHVAMLRFHNAVVDWLLAQDPQRDRRDTDRLFEDARRIVRWTFQWLVVNQFLKTLLREDVVNQVVKDGAKLYRNEQRDHREPYMPVEFSVACYRFGHSMIRNAYDYNRNFGRKPEGGPGFIIPSASLNLLFLFTGKSRTPFNPAGATPPPQVLPHNWIIEWDRFDGTSPVPENDPPLPDGTKQPARLAHKIDTHLSPRLARMSNEVADPEALDRVSLLLQHLARRNLRRGYQLSLPTGQAMARAVGATPMTREELGQDNSAEMNQAMNEGGFFDRTPLWLYILKEAEVREKGQRLGEVGSRVVAETFIGVLLADPESYLAQNRGWDPSQPVPWAGGGPLKLPNGRTITTISDLFRFAGVAV